MSGASGKHQTEIGGTRKASGMLGVQTEVDRELYLQMGSPARWVVLELCGVGRWRWNGEKRRDTDDKLVNSNVSTHTKGGRKCLYGSGCVGGIAADSEVSLKTSVTGKKKSLGMHVTPQTWELHNGEGCWVAPECSEILKALPRACKVMGHSGRATHDTMVVTIQYPSFPLKGCAVSQLSTVSGLLSLVLALWAFSLASAVPISDVCTPHLERFYSILLARIHLDST
ncbi:hypothetical protein FIBSPDRAFT_896852 [Athelia psychrophila]|uniref:Uncharacterized protein n=1 Tax=Athelia psychrophila TaxID=1759441 RepID=A0A166CY50_9AGAM|nr:hypothetical protein FIBSPDRAFT_896852 [Fibularhizoctonia sp. CBS 109695]